MVATTSGTRADRCGLPGRDGRGVGAGASALPTGNRWCVSNCHLSPRGRSASLPPPASRPLPAPLAPGGKTITSFSRFETELQVRPDDVDFYQHVHSTRYLDYVLAARLEQGSRCYGMPLAEF